MFTVVAESLVNEGLEDPELSADQLFAGLRRIFRAHDGRDAHLLPPGHHFEVLEDQDDHVVRRATLDDGEVLAVRGGKGAWTSRVSFHGDRLVVIEFIEGPSTGVMTQMVLCNDDGQLLLRMTSLTTQFGDLVHNSAEERELAATCRASWASGPGHTIAAVRQLLRDGVLD